VAVSHDGVTHRSSFHGRPTPQETIPLLEINGMIEQGTPYHKKQAKNQNFPDLFFDNLIFNQCGEFQICFHIRYLHSDVSECDQPANIWQNW
jgi:hypothetical protein